MSAARPWRRRHLCLFLCGSGPLALERTRPGAPWYARSGTAHSATAPTAGALPGVACHWLSRPLRACGVGGEWRRRVPVDGSVEIMSFAPAGSVGPTLEASLAQVAHPRLATGGVPHSIRASGSNLAPRLAVKAPPSHHQSPQSSKPSTSCTYSPVPVQQSRHEGLSLTTGRCWASLRL